MSTHTPGPWVSDGMANEMMEFRIYSPTGRVIAKIQDFTTFREDIEQAEVNAAFIVRACNSHEAMLEALKATRAFIESLKIPDSLKHNQWVVVCNAIAKAEGKG